MARSTSTVRTAERDGQASRSRRGLGKSERIAARLSPRQKRLLQRAADLEHRTLTEFLIASGLRSAEEVIQRHAVITLAVHEARAFMQAIFNAKPATPHLRRATERYRAAFGDR